MSVFSSMSVGFNSQQNSGKTSVESTRQDLISQAEANKLLTDGCTIGVDAADYYTNSGGGTYNARAGFALECDADVMKGLTAEQKAYLTGLMDSGKEVTFKIVDGKVVFFADGVQIKGNGLSNGVKLDKFNGTEVAVTTLQNGKLVTGTLKMVGGALTFVPDKTPAPLPGPASSRPRKDAA